MVQAIVINKCYGGFRLSREAELLHQKYSGNAALVSFSCDDAVRASEHLIRVVRELGVEAASGRGSQLHIVEIPDNVEWSIMDYDGVEWVAEKHRTWT